jgi:hypothetical protein
MIRKAYRAELGTPFLTHQSPPGSYAAIMDKLCADGVSRRSVTLGNSLYESVQGAQTPCYDRDGRQHGWPGLMIRDVRTMRGGTPRMRIVRSWTHDLTCGDGVDGSGGRPVVSEQPGQ